MDMADATSRKRKTRALNQTVHPEDKRKIIGDTFMNVRGHDNQSLACGVIYTDTENRFMMLE